MEISFINGTALQRSACLTAANNLLNLPADSIPLTLTVEFVKDPDPSQHNEFAITEWTYGSTSAHTQIASVAPAWPEPWRGVRFLQEVFAHELGHAIFAALPEWARIKTVEMFGLKSDDIDILKPPGSDWEDRVIEGVAETFKDAFLPQRFRRYPNRTNRHVSISRYPEFRALWREALLDAGGETDFGPVDLFNNVFGENLEVGWPRGWRPIGFNLDPETGKNFTKGIFRSHFGGKYAINNPVFFPPRFKYTATMPHIISYGFSVPAEWFPLDRTWVGDSLGGLQEYGVLFLWRYFASVNGIAVADYAGAWSVGVPIALKSSVAREFLQVESNASEDWSASDFWGPSGEEPASGIPWGADTMSLWRDAVVPPLSIGHSFTCDAGDELLIYGRAAGMQYWGNALISEENIGPGGLFNPPMGPLDLAGPELPELIFAEIAGGGEPIELPSGLVVPGGHDGGRVPTNYAVRGG